MLYVNGFYRELEFIEVLGRFLRIKEQKPNYTVLEFYNGKVVFSYKTPIAIHLQATVNFNHLTLKPGIYLLPQFDYSQTTKKHLKIFLSGYYDIMSFESIKELIKSNEIHYFGAYKNQTITKIEKSFS